ncbi:glycosyltransferase family 2 protein [Butyrivibrio sp. X503]|uniref:glycosyltransferase family A protein n=1 Tax=Butyrivibrio sp. X503 TaxID=2364878 RepID=UPI000EAA18C2|nr:glycosyltransferase family A protein [Butyrivibrio sp. X503]RKM54245.1 glycosyltransferase family 2 protein [Butyrivibrio sp. X503]
MSDRLEILISAVDKAAEELPNKMKIETDAVIVNQVPDGSGADKDEMIVALNGICKVLTRHAKGVGLSRNMALDTATHELIHFGDDDIVYDEGYSDRIIEEFDKHPEADVLLFNVKAQPGRETYWNEDFAEITWRNYGRYPAYAIAARREKLVKAGVRYSLLFGGGAEFMNGEDSLFLHDCLKAGLSMYRTPVALGHEEPGESTWFKGYTEKFFFDRGVLYHFLYGKMAKILGFRYLYKNKDEMCKEMGLLQSYKILVKGVKHGKKVKAR